MGILKSAIPGLQHGVAINYAQFGQLAFVAFFEQGGKVITPCLFESGIPKEQIEQEIIDRIRAGATAIAMVAEANYGTGEEAVRWHLEHGNLEDYPDKELHAVITYASPTEEFHLFSVLDEESRTVGPWERVNNDKNSVGRFINLFPRAVPPEQN